MLRWWKTRRRRKLLSEPLPEDWSAHLTQELETWSRFSDDERADLLDIARILMAEKRWEGCAGLELTEPMRVNIAVQAATLLLGIEHDYYRNVLSILVYPGGYKIPDHHESGMLAPSKRAVLGHTQVRGPVVLSWQHAEHGGRDGDDGRNLVYHEFAHKLDMLDGLVDGTPPLGNREQLRRWIEVMTAAYERLQSAAKKGRRSVLDDYGATNPGEFFSCSTEALFEKPKQLLKHEPDLYQVLAEFYGQDPARREP